MRKPNTVTAAAFAILLAVPLLLSACNRVPKVATNDDATLSVRVKTMLLTDPTLGAQRIEVDSAQGVVTLSGDVKNAGEAQRAVELAHKVAGVKDVKSALQVKPQ